MDNWLYKKWDSAERLVEDLYYALENNRPTGEICRKIQVIDPYFSIDDWANEESALGKPKLGIFTKDVSAPNGEGIICIVGVSSSSEYRDVLEFWDQIISINNDSTKNKSAREITSELEKIDQWEIHIYRKKENLFFSVKISKKATNAKKTKINRSGIPYIDYPCMLSEIPHIPEQVENIILDLRQNRWGYTENAHALSSRFLHHGKRVYHILDWIWVQTFSSSRSPLNHTKIIALTDSGTASGSEIFCSAIQSHNAWIIVWERTYGKWLQQITKVICGVPISYTNGHVFWPSGECWHGKWISPDIYATNSPNNIAEWIDLPYEIALQLLLNPKRYRRVLENKNRYTSSPQTQTLPFSHSSLSQK